jgi:hypothetical protein
VENEFSFLNIKVIQLKNKKKYKNKQVLSGEKPCLTACLAAFWNRASYIRSVCIIIILGYGEEWSPPQARW